MGRQVVVLGAGATGEAFTAALRRLDENADVTVVEHQLVGGECSYWACIPSKTLLRPLEVLSRARLAPGAAGALDGPVDIAAVFDWRDDQAAKDDASHVRWIERLGATLVRGTATVVEPGLVRADGRELRYDDLFVATGSLAAQPPVAGLADLEHWGSRDGTSASSVPESLLVVGGGAVGSELAQVYARLGARVTLVQNRHLLPNLDPEAGDLLAEFLREDGVDVRVGAAAARVEGGEGGYRLTLANGDEVEAERLLVATGRKPNVDGLGLDQLDVTVERSGIVVDERLRAGTGVWAAGDVTGVALFTHVGKYQGRVAAANVAGYDRRADYRAVPSCVFTDPQVAAVGDTSGEGVVSASWPLQSVARTGTYQRPKQPGFVKLYADPERRVLVGAIAVGPEAGEWLGQLTLAVRAEVPVETLRDTIQPFPTFSEAIFFAARDLDV